jgi:DNA-binding transcriptional ArsR family regulator
MSGRGHGTDSDGERNRAVVLLALAKGPRTGTDLRETLAARCGSKAAVSAALEVLSRRKLVRGDQYAKQFTWHLTQAGITEAMRLVLARQEARATT